jgi:hypothetical protein
VIRRYVIPSRAVKRAEFEVVVRGLMLIFGVDHLAVKVIRRRCPQDERCTKRDVAYVNVSCEPPHLVVVKRLLDMHKNNILGVLFHEFGHLADENSGPGAERRADRIAERVLGVKISYDRNDLQTVGNGTRPRPAHLHR